MYILILKLEVGQCYKTIQNTGERTSTMTQHINPTQRIRSPGTSVVPQIVCNDNLTRREGQDMNFLQVYP